MWKQVERKGRILAEHHGVLNPWAIVCAAVCRHLKLNHCPSCLPNLVASSQSSYKITFLYIQNILLICPTSVKLNYFTLFAIGGGLEAHVSLYSLITFLESHLFSYTCILSYATSARIPLCVGFIFQMHLFRM